MKKLIFLFCLCFFSLSNIAQDLDFVVIDTIGNIKRLMVLEKQPMSYGNRTFTENGYRFNVTTATASAKIVDTIKAVLSAKSFEIAESYLHPGEAFSENILAEDDENNFGFLFLKHQKTKLMHSSYHRYDPIAKLVYSDSHDVSSCQESYDWWLIISAILALSIFIVTLTVKKWFDKKNNLTERVSVILVIIFFVSVIIILCQSFWFFLLFIVLPIVVLEQIKKFRKIQKNYQPDYRKKRL
jgi:hypothetical protein